MIFTITGPESCGKSTLFEGLKRSFEGNCIPEYAREYLNKLDRKYRYSDLSIIAEHHIFLEKTALNENNNLLLDTDLMTIKIWGKVQFGKCPRIVSRGLKGYQDRKFILLYPDLPWEYDPLRENEHNRDMLFELYLAEIKRLGSDYLVIKGKDRMKQAKDFIRQSISFED